MPYLYNAFRRKIIRLRDRFRKHQQFDAERNRAFISFGTPTGSSSISMANGKASIEVEPEKDAKRLKMTVLNQSFKGTFLEIPLETSP